MRAMLLVGVLVLGGCAGGGDTPALVAHRGASFDAPENTLAAFREAWAQDSDAIEGDFYLTADGHIVCYHDKTLERTSGAEGEIERTTLAALSRLEAGAWMDERWAGEPIPTFAEVLATVPPGRQILIEVKSNARLVPVLKRQLATTTLDPSQIVIISFDEGVVAASKLGMPQYKAFWISDFDKSDAVGGFTPTVEELIATATRIGADGVDVNANAGALDEAMVAELRAAGLEVHVWTVNDPDVAREMADLGVDSITTDRPAWIRERIR